MAYQVLMQRLSFQPVNPDEPAIPTGDPEIVERGGLVPEYVAPHIIAALVNAGVIVAVADPDPTIIPIVLEPAAPVANPEVPPSPDVTMPPPGRPTTPSNVKPTARDSKAEWENYAETVGVPRADAESLTKAELIAEVDRRETGAL